MVIPKAFARFIPLDASGIHKLSVLPIVQCTGPIICIQLSVMLYPLFLAIDTILII